MKSIAQSLLRSIRARLLHTFVIGLIIRLAASWLSHGQPVADVASFFAWGKSYDQGMNPYESSGHSANYPPLWIYFCWLSVKLSDWSGLSFDLIVKLAVSLFDLTTVLAVARLTSASGATESQARDAALFYAINPVAILIASFHAQNDPVVIGIVAWASWLVLSNRFRWSIEAGMLVVGMSLAIKPIALLYLPIILLHISNRRRQALGLVLALAPSLLFWLPYLVESPNTIWQAVTSYQGVPDLGFIGILNSWQNLGHGSEGELVNYDLGVPYRLICIGVLGLVWWRFRKTSLVEQMVVLTVVLYLIHGKLAAQYLLWVMPFATAARSPQLLRLTITTSFVLVAYYQLHHPDIVTGISKQRLQTGITIPQWSGILFYAQALLFLFWLRWFAKLWSTSATSHDVAKRLQVR